jgi:SAM-dependent methyltransferase
VWPIYVKAQSKASSDSALEPSAQPKEVSKVAEEILSQKEPVPAAAEGLVEAQSEASPFSEILAKAARVAKVKETIKTLQEQQAPAESYQKENPFLDYTQRPTLLRECIKQAFEALPVHARSWFCHGSPEYHICGIDEYRLLETMVQEAPPDQKEFVILDVGGGDLSMSKRVAKFLSERPDLRPDCTFHIIGTTGESAEIPELEEIGRCKIHNLQGVKIEEIFDQLEQRGFSLRNKVDFAISHKCLRHLPDGVGTFQQVFNLLRPKTGFFLFDGFTFALEGQKEFEGFSPHVHANMIQVLQDTKAPFLTHSYFGEHNDYIARRPDDAPCHLPMSYNPKLRVTSGEGENQSCIVTEFRRQAQPEDAPFILPLWESDQYGDKELYEWLNKNKVFLKPFSWECLSDPDTPPLCRLLKLLGINKKQVTELLELPFIDVNAADRLGLTPLHYAALRPEKHDIVSLLVARGAKIDTCAKNGFTPFHYAAMFDTEGETLQTLLQAGTAINQKAITHKEAYGDPTPLDAAVKKKNVKAVELLIQAGAQISTTSPEALAAFAEPLLHDGKISVAQLEHAKIKLE